MKTKSLHPQILDFELTLQPEQEQFTLLKDEHLPSGEKLLWVGEPKLGVLEYKYYGKFKYFLYNISSLFLTGVGIMLFFKEYLFIPIALYAIVYWISDWKVQPEENKPIQYLLTPNEFGITFKDEPKTVHLIAFSDIQRITGDFRKNGDALLYLQLSKKVDSEILKKLKIAKTAYLKVGLADARPVFDLMQMLKKGK